MPEGILELAGAVAVELVFDRAYLLRAGRNSLRERGVNVRAYKNFKGPFSARGRVRMDLWVVKYATCCM